MAGSRLDRVGTIFSRATGLIKAGGVKYQDRPLWYDIYRVFPPKYEPHFDRAPERVENVAELLYPEDKYRARFYKKFGLNIGGAVRNINDRNFEDPSQPFVKICLEITKVNPEWSEHQIFDAACEKYTPSFAMFARPSAEEDFDGNKVGEGVGTKRIGRKSTTVITAQSLLSLFKEAKEQQRQTEDEDASKN